MKCNKKFLLPDFIQGKLSQIESTILREHIDKCKICTYEYKNLKSILNKLENENQKEPDETYWINLLPNIYQKISSKKFNYYQKYFPQIVGSAVILIFIALLIVKLFNYNWYNEEFPKNAEILTLLDSVDQDGIFLYNENNISDKYAYNNSDDFVLKSIILTSNNVEELYKENITIHELKDEELNYLLSYLNEEKKYKR